MLVANDADTLDPRYVTDLVGMRATRLVHAGLVRLDPDTLAPEPYVARGWRWLDPLTLEIDLREDVRFHSGAPLRPADVVATLRAFASPAVASRHASVIAAIAGADETGPHRVVVRLSRPHGTLLTDLELPILRADQAASPPAPDGTLDGLGPYAVAHVARGDLLLAPADGGASPAPPTPSSFAPSTTRTHAPCASRPVAPTSP
jgi:peptide/nickel transport system substrate-binding protein